MFPDKRTHTTEISASKHSQLQLVGRTIITFLLEDGTSLSEASVHRPTRGKIWVACFTGSEGEQVWRSTGLADREQALLVARRFEAQARTQRRAAKRPRPPLPHHRSGNSHAAALLTQKEVAQLLGIS